MNRVPINKKDVDSIFDLGFTSMVVCGWKWVKVQNDHEKWIFRILHGDVNFSIIIKL